MKLLLCSLALATCGFAAAQVAPSLTYDLTAKKPVLGATYDVGATYHSFFAVKGFDLTAMPLVGINGSGAGLLGGVLAGHIPLAAELSLDLGFGGFLLAGQKPHGTLYFGITKRS